LLERKKQKKKMRKKKAQLKVQETAFMLVALIFLFTLIFIFYAKFQIASLNKQRQQYAKQEAIAILQKFIGMPEFYIESGIDEDKIIALKNISEYEKMWKNIKYIGVREIYPGNKTIIIYNKDEKEVVYYSAFVPLCSTEQKDGYVWKNCKIASLDVGI
jgi:hypothetical protein